MRALALKTYSKPRDYKKPPAYPQTRFLTQVSVSFIVRRQLSDPSAADKDPSSKSYRFLNFELLVQ